MKMRQGFVSNSSTTSFCIYGFQTDTDAYSEKADQEYKKMQELGLSSYHNYNAGVYYYGMDVTKCADKETMWDFKQRAVNALKEFFGDQIIETYGFQEDAWYDG